MIALIALVACFILFLINREAGIGIGIVVIAALIAIYAYVPSINLLAF